MTGIRKRLKCRAGLGALLVATLTGTAVSSLAEGDLYRWQDEQGNPVLSDVPPPEGVEHEAIEKPPLLGTGGSVDELLAGDNGVADPNEPAVPGDAERCEQARANLDALNVEDGTVTVRNKDGSARELSASELQVQRAATQAQIEVYCTEQEN